MTRNQFALENNRRSSERAGTERQNVYARRAVAETIRIAVERFHLREKVVREKNGLGTLQMRIAGHDKIDMVISEIEQRGLQRAQPRDCFRDLGLYIKTQIECNLVIATSRSMQLSAGRTDSFG